MPQLLRTFGRIVARHGMLLFAWYLGGEAVHELLIQLAGFVGAHTTLGGLLLLPLAVAARLVSYVAMYLTVRPSLDHVASPEHGGPREFAAAILPAILPFFAFYAAWGMLNDDQIAFFNIAGVAALKSAGFDLEQLGDRGGIISIGLLPLVVLILALAARFGLARWRDRLPSWTLILAAYAEVLWTFMLFTMIVQWWADVLEWQSSTAGAQWFDAVGTWFATNMAFVATVWEAGSWLVGILMTAVVFPSAWLLVAGVIYGTRFDGLMPRMLSASSETTGAGALVGRVLAQRFEDLWAAAAVIWRSGPVLFGGYALAYALWALAEQAGTRGILHLFGGHDSAFWQAFMPLILIGVAAVAETLRVAIVSTAYDAVIARPDAGLESRAEGDAASGTHALSRVHGEADQGAIRVRDLEPERAAGVVGHQEHSEDVVGR